MAIEEGIRGRLYFFMKMPVYFNKVVLRKEY